MNDVKRYDFNPHGHEMGRIDEHAAGDYIEYDDHEKVIKALQAENEERRLKMQTKENQIKILQVENDRLAADNVAKDLHITNLLDGLNRHINKLKADAVREAADKLFYQDSEHYMFCYKYANKLEAGED